MRKSVFVLIGCILMCFLICGCKKETLILGTFNAVNISFAIDGSFTMDNQPYAGTWEKGIDNLYNVYVNQNEFQVQIVEDILYFPCSENKENCRIEYKKISEDPIVVVDSH